MSNVYPFVARKVRSSLAHDAEARHTHEAPTLRVLFRSEEGNLERMSICSTYPIHTRLHDSATRQAHSDAVARAFATLGLELVEVSYLTMSRHEMEASPPVKVAL